MAVFLAITIPCWFASTPSLGWLIISYKQAKQKPQRSPHYLRLLKIQHNTPWHSDCCRCRLHHWVFAPARQAPSNTVTAELWALLSHPLLWETAVGIVQYLSNQGKISSFKVIFLTCLPNWGCRCLIPGSIQGQSGQGSEKTDLVEEVPACCRRMGLNDL